MDLHTHAEKAPPHSQPKTAAHDVAYVCICTGNVVTIAAGEEPKFVLGQLIMLVAAIVISGAIWLTCALYSSVAG